MTCGGKPERYNTDSVAPELDIEVGNPPALAVGIPMMDDDAILPPSAVRKMLID